MKQSVHKKIKRLIEETNEAYTLFSSGGHINADYPEFASLSITEFKDILGNPDLTRRELVRILRRGRNEHKMVDPEGCWSTFLAHYVDNVSNGNVTVRSRSAARTQNIKQKA